MTNRPMDDFGDGVGLLYIVLQSLVDLHNLLNFLLFIGGVVVYLSAAVNPLKVLAKGFWPG